MPASINFNGFEEFQNSLHGLPERLFDEIDGEVADAAAEWEQLAKQATNPNIDTGHLHQNITHHFKSLMNWEVTSGAEYSAYLEWGTGTKVQVPTDLQDYASQFRGKKAVIGSRPYPSFFHKRHWLRKNYLTELKHYWRQHIERYNGNIFFGSLYSIKWKRKL